MPLFVATYDYTADAETRLAVRPRHRAFLSELDALVASGPTQSAAGAGASLVFEAGSADEVATLLDDDPFWQEGLIARRQVVEWTPILGRWVAAGLIP